MPAAVLETAIFPAAVLDAGERGAIVREAIPLDDDGVIVSSCNAVVSRSDRGDRETSKSTENHDCLLEHEHDRISCFQRNPLMTGR